MDPHECRVVLGVEEGADLAALRAARRRLLLRYHPDHNTGQEAWATEKTQRVLEAYRILVDRLGNGEARNATKTPSLWPTCHHDVRRRGRSEHRGPAQGTLFWAFDTAGSVCGSAVLDHDGNVCFGSRDGCFYCVSPRGALRWKVALGAAISSTPSVADDGAMYVGTEDRLAGVSETPRPSQVLAIEPGGLVRWGLPVKGGVSGSPAIGSDGRIYVGSHGGVCYALSCSGQVLWTYQAQGAIYSSPSIDAQGRVYVSAWDRSLYCLTPRGKLLWQFQTRRWVRSSPTIGFDGQVLIGSNSGHLHCLDADGKPRWQFPAGEAVTATAALGIDGRVYFGSSNRRFYALGPSGVRLWDFQTDGWILSSAAVAGDQSLYFGSCDRHVYSLRSDGTLRWRYATGGWVRSSPTIGQDGTLYVGSDDGKLYAFADR